jgi:hypothetical protein
VIPNAARFLTVGKGIAATPIGGPTGEPRLGIPFGARSQKEGRDHVRELHARGVRFVKIWVDDRNGDVPKLQPNVYRTIIAEAHGNGMEVLAHLSRTSALADAKDLLQAGIDGFVHMVRDRDVDAEYLAAVKAHPKVWTGPNIPVPATRDTIDALAETQPANRSKPCARSWRNSTRRATLRTSSSSFTAATCARFTRREWSSAWAPTAPATASAPTSKSRRIHAAA